MENEFENQDSLNTDVEETETADDTGDDVTTDTEEVTTEPVEDVEALKKQNKELYARAKKAEEEAKAAKQKAKGSVDPHTLERLDEIERNSLGIDSDDIWDEVKSYSQLKGIPLRQAFKSEYIQFRTKEVERKQREEAASIASSNNPSRGTTRDFSKAKPTDFDTSTDEGQKEWEAYKAYMKTN